MGSIKGVQTLKTKREFDRVYKYGRGFHSPYFVIFYRKDPEIRVGFVASKKLGKSVRRNRAKRLLRALFLDNIDLIESGSYVFVAKPRILESDYASMKQRFIAILRSLRHSVHD